ncbi:MAG: hypothetical protein GOU98_00220 [Candidatus Altiarchaeota archaeon]|nr:hypothetical protein [Candidatus Altiarchaeota archaeon]
MKYMDLKGFDVYSFPSKPEVLYAIRDYEIKIKDSYFKFVIELFIRQNCPRILIKQGNSRNPQFLIRNMSEGLLRPIGAGVAREIRKIIFQRPVGDIFEGCVEAIADIGSVFGSMPLPGGSVVVRIPVILANHVEFENKTKNRRQAKRVVFELKPQGFGYMIATQKGLEIMIDKIDKGIKVFSPE